MKLFHVLCLLALAFVMSACNVMWTQNRTITTKGSSYEQSFSTVQDAMREKGYLIAEADKKTGVVRTEKRTDRDFWYQIEAHVAQDGSVEFMTFGSEKVMKGEKVHKTILNRTEILKKTFEKLAAQSQPKPS
jgi:hypothetical protein